MNTPQTKANCGLSARNVGEQIATTLLCLVPIFVPLLKNLVCPLTPLPGDSFTFALFALSLRERVFDLFSAVAGGTS